MPKPIAPSALIEGPDVHLTLLTADEAEQLRLWRSDPANAQWFGDTRPITAQEQAAWFARYEAKPDDLMFAIRAQPENAFVGVVSLYGLNAQDGSAEYGRLLLGDPQTRGRGLAAKASFALCAWAFRVLEIKSIFLWVKDNNVAARNVYYRLGFKDAQPIEDKHGFVFMTLKPADLTMSVK